MRAATSPLLAHRSGDASTRWTALLTAVPDSDDDGLLELPAGKRREYENVFPAMHRKVRKESGLQLTRIHGAPETDRQSVLEYDVQAFRPHCLTQNLTSGYSIQLSTFLCEADGEPVAPAGETAAPPWTPLTDITTTLAENPDAFSPLHLPALRKDVKKQVQPS